MRNILISEELGIDVITLCKWRKAGVCRERWFHHPKGDSSIDYH